MAVNSPNAAYHLQVELWRREAKVKVPSRHYYDLSKISASTPCKKCGSHKGLARHHKGHEFLCAQLYPRKYSRRYLEFRREDCVWLCEDCHLEVHAIYTMVMYGVYAFSKGERPPAREVEMLRVELVKLCEWWLNEC